MFATELNVLCKCSCGYEEERMVNIGICPKCGEKVKAQLILDSKIKNLTLKEGKMPIKDQEFEELKTKISNRFREVREWREMKRWYAAARMGMYSEYLGMIESGEIPIFEAVILKASRVYRVERDILLCRKDIPRDGGGGKKGRTKNVLVPHPATS